VKRSSRRATRGARDAWATRDRPATRGRLGTRGRVDRSPQRRSVPWLTELGDRFGERWRSVTVLAAALLPLRLFFGLTFLYAGLDKLLDPTFFGVVIKLPDGTFVAFDTICTHAGCTVEWDAADAVLLCPCHDAVFDAAHGGAVLAGPAPSPLASLPIVVDNASGMILLGG
jgi:Rieske Fe-S protein